MLVVAQSKQRLDFYERCKTSEEYSMKHAKFILILVIFAMTNQQSSFPQTLSAERKDYHSYSNPEQVKVRHVDLDWDVLFDQKILKGTAVLSLERVGANKNT